MSQPKAYPLHRLLCSWISFILIALFLVSCEANPNPVGQRVPMQVGKVVEQVEIADKPDSRETGLMFRKELSDDHGMLFVFEKDDFLNFWMKNTFIPLSIAYIDSDGTIREFHDMVPFSEANVSSNYAVRYALEVPKGAFVRRGIQVGDRIDLGVLQKKR